MPCTYVRFPGQRVKKRKTRAATCLPVPVLLLAGRRKAHAPLRCLITRHHRQNLFSSARHTHARTHTTTRKRKNGTVSERACARARISSLSVCLSNTVTHTHTHTHTELHRGGLGCAGTHTTGEFVACTATTTTKQTMAACHEIFRPQAGLRRARAG